MVDPLGISFNKSTLKSSVIVFPGSISIGLGVKENLIFWTNWSVAFLSQICIGTGPAVKFLGSCGSNDISENEIKNCYISRIMYLIEDFMN